MPDALGAQELHVRGFTMLYLGNNHIGFDTQTLAFPSILGCQAVVYQTTQGIYGFHDMKGGGGADVDPAKATAFAQWVQAHNILHATQALQIYGVINQTHQYGKDTAGKAAWLAMLTGIATALGFNGHIYGVRLTAHVAKTDSVYVRYDINGTKCTIRYKRWSKMDYDKTNQIALQPTEQQALGKTSPFGMAAQYTAKNPYDDIYAVKRKGKAAGTLLADEGSLNTVSESSIKTLR